MIQNLISIFTGLTIIICCYLYYREAKMMQRQINALFSSVNLCLFKIKLLEEYNNKAMAMANYPLEQENDNEKT